MHAIEAAGTGRKAGQAALALVLTADTAEQLDVEIGQAKAALLAWKSKHGSACGSVLVTIVPAPELRELATQLLDKTHQEDVQLSSLLQRVPVDVSVLNVKGKPVCKYRLGREQPRFKPESDRPWWKFWQEA